MVINRPRGSLLPTHPRTHFVFHRHFKAHGYRVVSGGKVAHGNSKEITNNVDEYLPRPADARGNFTDEKANLWGEGGPHNHADEKTGDYKVAQWAIERMEKRTCKRQTFADDGGLLPASPSVQCPQGLL